ncbi:MAG: Rieske (2Fe-2S) protein [Ignavibacteria bacterium]|nr:Rieske (2Fe-2S) protein [Ignavibacteria bacterium]
MDRKDFITTCSLVCLGALPLTLIATGCAGSVYQAQHTRTSDAVLIARSEFEDRQQDGTTTQRPFVVVSPAGQRYPIGVYAMADGTFIALLLCCTHRNCELQPQPTYLVCPCHGSEFTIRGKVQSPPAQADLQSFPVTMEGGTIAIRL